MTRKDYELIAKQFFLYGASNALIMHMAEALQKDNPRFNREIFLNACGLSVKNA